jgi:hypothetical protein
MGRRSRLRFNFGFTDLAAALPGGVGPARYLEVWVPANLIWDQCAMTLDVEVTGTGRASTDHQR